MFGVHTLRSQTTPWLVAASDISLAGPYSLCNPCSLSSYPCARRAALGGRASPPFRELARGARPAGEHCERCGSEESTPRGRARRAPRFSRTCGGAASSGSQVQSRLVCSKTRKSHQLRLRISSMAGSIATHQWAHTQMAQLCVQWQPWSRSTWWL